MSCWQLPLRRGSLRGIVARIYYLRRNLLWLNGLGRKAAQKNSSCLGGSSVGEASFPT